MGGLMSPGPRRQPGGGRMERDARRHSDRTGEVSGLLAGLLQFLSGYQRAQRITDGLGRVWELPWARSTGSGALAGGGGAGEHPLLCVNAATEDAPRRVRVVSGGIGGKILLTDGGPFVPGDDPATYVTVLSGASVIYARAVWDGSTNVLQSWTLEVAATLPAPTYDEGCQPLAYATYEDDVLSLNQYVGGSQHAVRCPDPYDEMGIASYTWSLV